MALEQILRKATIGGALIGGLLVATPAQADITIPTTGNQAIVRVNNPSEVSVTDYINGQAYTIGAHQTVEETVQAPRIAIVPGADSQGNQYPDPIVDVETGQNGFISSPPLYTLDDLAYDGQLFGLGTGATLLAVTGHQASRIAVYTLGADGTLGQVIFKDLNADDVATFTPTQLFGTLAPGTTMGVEYVTGSGQAALVTSSPLGDERYQRMGTAPGTLLGRLYVDKWIKPSSKPLKLNPAQSFEAMKKFAQEIAAFSLQDPVYNATFRGNLEACTQWYLQFADGNPNNGELYGNIPIRVVNDRLSFESNKKDANKVNIPWPVPVKNVPGAPAVKFGPNAPGAYDLLRTTILPELAKEAGYGGNFNVSPKTTMGATWAHN